MIGDKSQLHKRIEFRKGFTLAETLIAIFIFVIIVTSAVALLVSGMMSQRKSISLQTVQDNARYALESIAKEIRMSTINSSSGYSGSELKITAHKQSGDVEVSYRLQNNKIERGEGSLPDYQAITSDDVKVTNLMFYLNDYNIIVGPHPRVTVVIETEAIGDKPEQQAKINLQTTLSSRSY